MSDTKNILIEKFKTLYGVSPVAVGHAPGRLEILGNHTDYNEGLVLSSAVGQRTSFAIAPNPGKICKLTDFRDGSSKEFSLDDIEKPVKGDWSNYVKGVIQELRKRDIEIDGFNGAILSTVPLSAGMSSSAALEICAAFAFAATFGIDLPKPEWARIGQGVENHYMGVQSGLLDQFSSLFGERDSLIFCDFREVAVKRTVKVPHGYVFVVANSMLKHDLVDSDYNQRRISCENAVRAIQGKHGEVKALRDVSMAMLEECESLIAPVDYLRAKHIVGENERVIAGTAALDANDVKLFGQYLYESHESSKVNFENSCDELDLLVELSKTIPGCVGARLSGGGFGGISIHLVEEVRASQYCAELEKAFQAKTGVKTETIICQMGDGATCDTL